MTRPAHERGEVSRHGVRSHRGCEGFGRMPRRAALTIGSIGALGLSLGDLLRLRAARGEASSSTAAYTAQAATQLPERIRSVIQLNLPGGLPQQESFDPKPEAPVEYRGAFGVVKTNTGEIFSDNFPKTAAIADKVTIVRSVVGRIPDHAQATYHLFTGYTPTAVIDYPQMGSVISHELGSRGELPPYIAIPAKNKASGGTGFLSSTFGPFELNADPGKKDYKIRDFAIPEGVSLERMDRRSTARQLVESYLRKAETDPAMLDTMDDFYKRAFALLTSETAREAFSLEGETDETRQLYGCDVTGLREADLRFHPKGLAQRLMLARRLVEGGSRFVTVEFGAWDSHVDTKRNCLDQMPAVDHAISGLVTDLDRRGLLDTTLVWVTTEFGRTPKINKDSGRDHWARCYSMLLAGGGLRRGYIHGASDSTAAEPSRDAVPLEHLLFTIYHGLGIDAEKELVAFGTRPIEIVKDGKLVKEILA